jgi:hypothetical protein
MIAKVVGSPKNTRQKKKRKELLVCLCLSSCYEFFVDGCSWAFAPFYGGSRTPWRTVISTVFAPEKRPLAHSPNQQASEIIIVLTGNPQGQQILAQSFESIVSITAVDDDNDLRHELSDGQIPHVLFSCFAQYLGTFIGEFGHIIGQRKEIVTQSFPLRIW